MKFRYAWQDDKGIIHFTSNIKEANEALHRGFFVNLVPREMDERKAE